MTQPDAMAITNKVDTVDSYKLSIAIAVAGLRRRQGHSAIMCLLAEKLFCLCRDSKTGIQHYFDRFGPELPSFMFLECRTIFKDRSSSRI